MGNHRSEYARVVNIDTPLPPISSAYRSEGVFFQQMYAQTNTIMKITRNFYV